ncbi:DUF5105 domain-containing protein [Carnobacterium gallinarum]|uniref:DUF5105 domain-containing protein n=1 Tax=Carnobacterium gallinarum TaxID=2749 RepID=UPI0005523EFF|nr:DUF5105 domain-containing protein [Carnobacterium gallinarum]
MKKFSKVLGFSLLSVLLVGCGGKAQGLAEKSTEVQSSSSSEVAEKIESPIEVKLNQGYFVLFNETKKEETKKERLVLELEVKNLVNNANFLNERKLALLNKATDEVIKTYVFKEFGSGVLQEKNEKATGALSFDVEEGAMYDLVYQVNDDWLSLNITVDPADYQDTKTTLEDPLTATNAYFNVLAFNEEDANYQKLVSNNLQNANTLHQNLFKDKVLGALFSRYKPDEATVLSMYQRFQAMEKKRATIVPTLISNDTEKAIVSLQFEIMSHQNIKDLFFEKSQEIGLATHWSGILEGKEEEATIPQFDEIMEQTVLVRREEPLVIELVKVEDKWEFDLNNENFQAIFYGGYRGK